ncbi:hypothetical protein BOH66_04210 [Microbacterium aurum]|uniref:Membrane insertase YidC/Oxa/ALB C-terminal domain-containing protein n=1 Tax=Microbacterium aurum TaxID=36805 RepID=A0A1P8U633_9MICO|nr:hypothetical protein BOH66_04210 [Microbacterium aurum]
MNLYRAEGASPLAGCLPLLIQAPVVGLLYSVFLHRMIDGHANELLTQTLAGPGRDAAVRNRGRRRVRPARRRHLSPGHGRVDTRPAAPAAAGLPARAVTIPAATGRHPPRQPPADGSPAREE